MKTIIKFDKIFLWLMYVIMVLFAGFTFFKQEYLTSIFSSIFSIICIYNLNVIKRKEKNENNN